MKLLPSGASYPIGVVAHHTQCRNANIELLGSFVQQTIETKPVRLVEENVLATVPAEHHVRDSVWILSACSLCHQTRISSNMDTSSLIPHAHVHRHGFVEKRFHVEAGFLVQCVPFQS